MFTSLVADPLLLLLWGAALVLAVSVAIRLGRTGDSGHGNRGFYLVLAVSIGLFILFSIYFYEFTVDDVYISLTYARNLAQGHGPVHSVEGEIVEGYTNFLWVLFEAVFFLMSVPEAAVIHCIKIAGILFGMGIIIVTAKTTELIRPGTSARVLAPVLLSATPYFSMWAVGGLETPMYMFLLMVGLYRFGLELRDNGNHLLSMVMFLLLAVTRPEGLIVGLMIITWGVFATIHPGRSRSRSGIRNGLKRLLPGILIFLGLYALYFLWRFSYYGYPLPNTFYAKAGQFGIVHVLRRLNRMKEYIGYILPLAAVGFFACVVLKAAIPRFKHLFGLILVLLIALSFVSKGEWMPGFRYELPFLPFIYVFFSQGIVLLIAASRGSSHESRRLSWGLSGLLCLLMLHILYPSPQLSTYRLYGTALEKAHIALGRWMHRYVPDDGSMAGWDMGAIPYYSNLPEIQEIHPVGLLSAYTTHRGYDPEYFLSREPSIIVLPPKPDRMPKDYERNPNYQILTFYDRKDFIQNYEYLFSFAFAVDYVLDVYIHTNVSLPGGAVDEGKELGARSFRWARSVAAVWNSKMA